MVKPATRVPTPTSGLRAATTSRRPPAPPPGRPGTPSASTARSARTSGRRPHASRRPCRHADNRAPRCAGPGFLTVAHNRCMRRSRSTAPKTLATRVELDIEGNQRAVATPANCPRERCRLGRFEQRIVMRYDYDMLGNRIHQPSMEAGERWILNDVTGKPIRAWDSRGHDFTTTYDAVRRTVKRTVRRDDNRLNIRCARDKPRSRWSTRSSTAKAPTRMPTQKRLNLRTRIYATSTPQAWPPTRAWMPTATRPKPTTSRATCGAAHGAWQLLH